MRAAPVDLGGDLATERPKMLAMLGAMAPPDDVVSTATRVGEIDVVDIDVVQPDVQVTDGELRILYVRGGDYALGDAATSVGLASELLRRVGARAVSVDYRLAPEHPAPAAVEDVLAGGLVASASAADVGQPRLAEALLGLGLICWAIVGSMILSRLVFRPPLPDALVPTMAIEIAPAAVATIAYLTIDGGRTGPFAAALAGYGILMIAAQGPLLPRYLRLPFSLGTWAFTFSWAAAEGVDRGVDLRVRFPVDDAALSALHDRAFGSPSTTVHPWARQLDRHSLT